MERNIIPTATTGHFIQRIWKGCFILAFSLMIGVTVQAQGGVEGDPDDPVPFDGGISLMLAAGVGYGVKKVADARKRKQG